MDKRKKDRKRVIDGDYRLDGVAETYFDVSATVNVAVRDKKDESTALSIECTYEGHFHGVPPVQRDLAERFVKSQLRVVLWPYVRQFVSDTTARMSIGPVFLPFYLGTGQEQEKAAEAPRAVIAERPALRGHVRRRRKAN
jgi:preprotein translocase subunit SecB